MVAMLDCHKVSTRWNQWMLTKEQKECHRQSVFIEPILDWRCLCPWLHHYQWWDVVSPLSVHVYTKQIAVQLQYQQPPLLAGIGLWSTNRQTGTGITNIPTIQLARVKHNMMNCHWSVLLLFLSNVIHNWCVHRHVIDWSLNIAPKCGSKTQKSQNKVKHIAPIGKQSNQLHFTHWSFMRQCTHSKLGWILRLDYMVGLTLQ